MTEAEKPGISGKLADLFASLPPVAGAVAAEKVNPAESAGLDGAPRRFERRVRGREFLDLSRVDDAAAHIATLPRPGYSVHCLMPGTYHGWDIVPAIQRLDGSTITQLWVATLGFNMANLDQLTGAIDAGLVAGGGFLCSSHFAKSDRAEYEAAHQALTARGWKVAHCRNHAKVLLVQTAAFGDFVVESSANLRSCNNLEQFCLSNDAALFGFHREWIERAIDHAAE